MYSSYSAPVGLRFDDCNIWFPNAVTPNNDGKNDLAGVRGNLGYYTDFSLGIYNRWGERVYYTEDIYTGWNGIYKEVEQELGVYFYMIFYNLHVKKSMLKGELTLIRYCLS
ncbi:MAG: gliding motility-associated C-terminal domain-containing protein [Taibaiella sp.]|nr:gliding motility-associated C-terminal domain-containing protein [Taibaiella sp.]